MFEGSQDNKCGFFFFSRQSKRAALFGFPSPHFAPQQQCKKELLVSVDPMPQSWIIYVPVGEIIKTDLRGNQFSCCVLNGGIEMKCGIIKKITSRPSHVIMMAPEVRSCAFGRCERTLHRASPDVPQQSRNEDIWRAWHKLWFGLDYVLRNVTLM